MSSRRKMFAGQTGAPNENNMSTERSKLGGQTAASGQKSVCAEKPTLAENVAALYLDESFSDVTFLVSGEKLPAHKAVLAARNKSLETLFKENCEKKELTISNTSPEAFRLLLKYIYTDTITVPPDNELVVQVLILARQYSSKHLTSTVIREINKILDEKVVCMFLNAANDHDLDELRNACHSFMDDNALQILSSDYFSDLTQKSMIQILKRDVFVALKSEIIKGVVKWCEKNKNVDEIISECVRLSLVSVSDTLSIVWPKLVNSEKLVETIAEITANRSKDVLPGTVSYTYENVATAQNNMKEKNIDNLSRSLDISMVSEELDDRQKSSRIHRENEDKERHTAFVSIIIPKNKKRSSIFFRLSELDSYIYLLCVRSFSLT